MNNQNFMLEPVNNEERENSYANFEGLDFTPVEEYENKEKENVFEGLDFTPVDETKEEQERTITSEVLRHGGRSLARAGEAILGLPGNVQSLMETGVHKLISWAGGEDIANLAMREDPYEPKVRIGGMDITPGKLPTSEDFKNLTKALTGDKLEPQSFGEEIADEIVGDVASLVFPMGGQMPLAKAVGMSTIGTFGKEFVKEAGFGETGQMVTKFGLMTMTGLIDPGSARRFASKEYKKAVDMVPENTIVAPGYIENRLAKFTKEIRKGGMSPQKEPAFKLSKELKNTIKEHGGVLPVDELPAYRVSVNDYRFGGENLTPRAHYFLDKFDHVLNETLFEYGKTNPAFLKQYSNALMAHAGVKQTGKISNFISRKINPNKFSPQTVALFVHAGLITPKAIGTMGAAFGVAQAYKIVNRFATNKVLRKHYINTIKEASKGNATAMINNLQKLDKDIKNLNIESEYDFDFEQN